MNVFSSFIFLKFIKMTYNGLPVVQFLIVNFTKGSIKRRSQARYLQQRTFIRIVYEAPLSEKQQFL